MEIRVAKRTDIPALLRLLQQVGGVHHDIRPDIFRENAIKYTHSQLETLLEDEEKPIYVACEADSVLGYCFCQWRQTRDSTVQTDRLELYIDDLCVDEACRGQGVATALYRYVTDLALARDCHFITLNVWRGNDSAMAFYEKMGLKPRNIMMEMPLKEVAEC